MSELKIPEDFPNILRDFTREILRNQPMNIYEFAVKYFQRLISEREEASGQQDFTPAILARFHQEDSNKTGTVSPEKVCKILAPILHDLGYGKHGHLLHLLGECKVVDEAKVVLYESVAKNASQILPNLPKQVDPDITFLRGMEKTMFLERLRESMYRWDEESKTQILGPTDLLAYIKTLDFGLTQKEQIILWLDLFDRLPEEITTQKPDFLLDAIVEIISYIDANNVDCSRSRNLEGWTEELVQITQEIEGPQVSPAQLRDLLLSTDVGISSKEVLLLISHVEADDDCLINLEKFIEIASTKLFEWFDQENASERAAVLDGRLPKIESIRGVDRDEVEDVLREELEQADVEQNGWLIPTKLRNILTNSELNLTHREIQALMAIALVNSEETAPFESWLSSAYDVLFFVCQQEAVDKAISESKE